MDLNTIESDDIGTAAGQPAVRTTAAKKVFIKTYGCQMNVYDSSRMRDVLAPLGYDETENVEAADFVADAPATVAATITPQHLHLNRNALFAGGLRPHAYCLPVVKREKHRLAVRAAAVSGSPKFFLGTDSAPHAVEAKEAACGCAGIFNAPFALESYAAVFEEEGALDRLEGFASEHGPLFYGLPLNQGTVTLERGTTSVPGRTAGLVPFHAGGTLGWRLAAPDVH